LEKDFGGPLGEMGRKGDEMIFKLLIVGFIVSMVISYWLWRGVMKLNNKVKTWLEGLK
jgi:hypothetical protein